MTHTVHPYAHRLGVIRDWKSRWFGTNAKQYRDNLRVDTMVREYLTKRLRGLYVTALEIERGEKELRLNIKTSRPGMVIGRSGEGTQKLLADITKQLQKLRLGDEMPKVKIDVEEVRSPESHAAIVAYMVAEGLEKRMPHRRILKQTVEKVMANRDVKGVRVALAGRLGGAEMARREEIKRGRIPLQTFRADIDYAKEKAYLPYGIVGIKVWVYRGDIFEDTK
ncbi:MAG: 30S ribosomal protein S3 [Parcubacteria group bacterium]|nr:30S ribosomal protein S3 [Parcubacteria group bacterium]|tara:strand:+ start:24375 stop:25043 length:669 start_codon:yes stop_codon:yes gene_type:complete